MVRIRTPRLPGRTARVPASLLALALIAIAACTPRIASRGFVSVPDDAEAREVVRTVERMFEAMRTRDTTLLRSLLLPELVVVSVRDSAGRAIVRRQTVDAFLLAIAGAPGELRERMWDPEVRLDGAIATLWAPYDFHIGDRFSHCGHDAFQLARGERGWHVTGLIYTVKRTCDRAPAPP